MIVNSAVSKGIDTDALEEKSMSVSGPADAVPELKSPIVDAPVYTVTKIEEVSWADTFRRALEGPTGQMVVHIAKEVIARQVGGTQVLSLNLTNLLILLFLKAIIFAAGLIGAGSWGQYARSLDNGKSTTRVNHFLSFFHSLWCGDKEDTHFLALF